MAGAGKGSAAFRDTIKAWLDGRAATDEFFARSYENPDKSFDACIDYILTTVKSSGCNGFTDDEIFGMALHYYDEEDPGKIQHGISAQCVVNHRVELTEAEIAEAKQKALDKITEDEVKKEKEAKKRAAEKLREKAEEKRKQLEAEGQFSLFGED